MEQPAREPAWAEHEKVYLLAEILKASPVPTHVLYGLLRDYNVQPRWNDIALPHGRSLRSCQVAYSDITATYSGTDYRRPPPPAPVLYPGPELPKKRPLQPETSTPIGRLLQPRPPHTFPDQFMSGPAYATAMSPVGEPANKKKRGRPTKAEAQQRAQEAAARGEVYPPPRKSRPSVSSIEQPPGEARPQMQTPPGAAPPLPPGAVTPQQTHQELPQESSSGKKKRGKPTPLELKEMQRLPGETESPLAFGSAQTDPNRPHAYSSFTPISAPLPSSSEPRDRDVRMEGVEESQPRTTTPHSFKDTVGI
ncbi:hypothetical protein K458DRAFT_153126 [Lentithecium fluviatile CBS 122367]|uniref:AT hook domain-containing protein n=1 Tax=Lentithecium fluviatile CBS 122367 TaxID=1168545 RepID=A0A6G1JEF1_9PLEO|nr:hypothetical protein K458DRAFT_153126 [Lentithecium fluviatile CBS 122367]